MEPEAEVSSAAAPHATRILVWDIPSSVVAGGRFSLRVGMKCSDECDLSGRAFSIRDRDANEVAAGSLSSAIWPGSSGLHHAEVTLDAPGNEGLYNWTVTALPSSDGVPHAGGHAEFGLRVVAPPECTLAVEAIDRATGAPVEGTQIVMHPYRAVTDAQGRAEIGVAKGTYRLFVSRPRYLTYGVPLEIGADTTVRVELDREPKPERN